MKKSYLVFCILALVFTHHSQTLRVDYDNSSKWFLGFNVGGTWNTTDVSNKTAAGWGVILGKSYGFKSYSPFTFDIRARYLRGFWYGQDSDTSSLSGYTGSALSAYTSQGMTVHNFQSDVHRLGLELAIHMNKITSRSGWDPYIFGGIGFTWHQTFSNLINQNDTTGGSVYNYSSMLTNPTSLSEQIENTLDDVYDSPLDGYKSGSYNVAFMPSLGIGLGYHIGKRITLGVEHKTTFTLRDDFDGLVSSVRPKNDLYHYTSLYLRFRFRGRQPSSNVTNTPCYTPSISIIQPAGETTVTNPQYTIEANLSEVTNSNQISVVNNTGQNVPFNFNSSSKKLTANVLLVPGQNSFTIRVNNRCGSDSKVVSVNFLNCSLPSAIFTSPTTIRDTVRSSAYTVSAAITGISSIQGIRLLQNNVLLNGYSYNVINGLLQASVNLVPGRNTFTIELYNACGSNSIISEIFYNDCINPSITLVSPSATGTTVSSPQFMLSAIATGIADRNQLSITQNNVSSNAFTLVNGKIDLNTILNPGINTFTLSVYTRCGTASQTFTVNYQTCNAPVITIENPLTNSTVSTSNLTLRAKVFNVENRQNILVNVNGLALKNITYTKASNSLEVPLNLSSGANSITITATNSCGADVETITLYYNPCVAPKITLSSMSSVVTNSAYTFNATILNQPSNQGISLTLNGNPVNYSYSNNLLSTNVNLQNGINKFVLSITNPCGTDANTWIVTNNNCVIPGIVLENPTASGITINSSNYNFKASLVGMPSTQGIQFLVNNVPYSFNYENGILSSNLNLNAGANIIKITLQNNCGNANKEVVINYQNCDVPSISINQPVNNNFTTNQSLLNLTATVSNISGNQGITAKLNGIGIPYQLNSNMLTASANLQPGANTILLTATNSCGTDVKAVNVNYDNCIQPQVSITNTATTSSNSAFTFNATLIGSNLNQGISLTHNGNVKSYTINGSTLSAAITLSEGLNTFILSAVNSCGNDTKTYSINYTPCLTPTVTITNPASNNLTFNAGNFTFQSQVAQVSSASQIVIVHNGSTVSNFGLNNDQVVASINLVSGNNTIKITVTSNCGTDSKTISLIGKSCDAPTVTINSSSNSSNSTYNLQATLTNISTNQGILVSLNGNIQTNYNYTNGNLTSSMNLINGVNTIVISANNECGNASKSIIINYQEPEEEKITICHIPPGNPNNPQTIEIPASAWAAHQAHGDVLGACVPTNPNNGNNNNTPEEKITICHIPPGNPNNPQTIEIPASAWAAHQAHGDVLGACVPTNPNNGNDNNDQEEKITICHIPPGNPNNPQTIEIPASAWATHQAHGDVLGACVPVNTNNENNSNNGNNEGNSSEEMMVICVIHQGRNGNSETITIPVSQWPQYQSLGATVGPCTQNSNENSGNENPNNSGSGNNNNNNNQNNGGSGNNNSNGNNGHGNNTDGVDSSNPGQGEGGPNGVNDPSGNVDDEGSGSGSINSNSNNFNSNGNQNTNENNVGNGNSNNGNSNQNNSNSVGTEPSGNGTEGSEGNQNNGGSGNNNSNGNNGHGNNTDGVDSSNPGQGGGGPNGVNDPSGNVDDEDTGSGSINSNSNNSNSNGTQNTNQNNVGNGNSNNGNSNQNNTNSGGTEPSGNGTGSAGGSENTNNNGNSNNNGNGVNQGSSEGGNNSGGSGKKNQQNNNSGGNKPTVNQNNSGGNKPTVNQNNSGGNKPAVNQNNSGGNKPTVNLNNSGGNKPTVNQNNSGGNKPAVNQNNSGGNKPAVNQNNSGGNKPEVPKGNKKGGN